jgi:ABC-type nickel/cobalt efflux system permease component RcnA
MFDVDFGMLSSFGSLIFIVAIVIILFTILKGLMEWSQNNKQPVLSVSAKVVTKRTENRRHQHHHQDHHHQHHSTSYYATFEVESGDRIEFSISGKEYGQLAEGDDGKLIFQGTRFHRFERY